MPYEPTEEQRVLFDDIEKLQAPRKSISRLADTDETLLSRAANGTRSMSYVEFKPVRKIVDDLLLLKERAAGVPIDWSDIRSIRRLLTDLREERLNPPAPLSERDAALLHSFSRGESLDELAAQAGLSREGLLDHVTHLLGQTSRLVEVKGDDSNA